MRPNVRYTFIMRRVAVLLLPLLLAGCVERSLIIRSDPPGAEVYEEGVSVGQTPFKMKYAHYGTRELIVLKTGYKSHRRLVELNAPWWQIFPLDFVTDVLLPITLTDEVELDITLEKEPEGAAAFPETLKRAEEARDKANPPEPK